MGPGALALLILLPVALVGFLVDGAVLLERQDSYRATAAQRAAAAGAAAASSASRTRALAPDAAVTDDRP